MIKFFRKIRQNLLSEGKTRKYLYYAFGEIILVVIGIFIAIQLNNYNEYKKSEKSGLKVLKKLKQEIKQDISYMDSLSVELNDWQKQAQYILDSVMTGNVTKLERLDQYNIGTGTMNFIQLNKSSYQEILNDNYTIGIKDKNLKYKIVLFFQEADKKLNKLNLDNERFNQWTYNNVDITVWYRLSLNRNLNYEDWAWLQNPSSKKFRSFEGYILFFQAAINANLAVMEELKLNFHNLSDLLNHELKK